MILNDPNYPFLQNDFYFNSLLYIFECIVLNKLNYENKKYYNSDIGMKDNFDIQFIQKRKNHTKLKKNDLFPILCYLIKNQLITLQ